MIRLAAAVNFSCPGSFDLTKARYRLDALGGTPRLQAPRLVLDTAIVKINESTIYLTFGMKQHLVHHCFPAQNGGRKGVCHCVADNKGRWLRRTPGARRVVKDDVQ